MEESKIHVANLELCKELYKLSGWTTDWEWYIDPEGSQSLTYVPGGTVDVYDDDTLYPAYDLGYLLRKLPYSTYIQKMGNPKANRLGMGGYRAWNNNWTPRFRADTPENAAAKLAIELFRQGVLTKLEAAGSDE